MKICKLGMILCSMLMMLSGCGMKPFANGDETPEGVDTEIREKYYEDFVSMYETYEKNVEETDGNFIDENGDVVDFEEGTFGDGGDVMTDAAEGTRREEEEGGEKILNDTEDELHLDMLTLSMLRTLDGFTQDMNQSFWDNNPELVANDVGASLIQVEEKVIDTLDLDKKSIELVRVKEAEASAEQEVEEAAEQQEQEQAEKEAARVKQAQQEAEDAQQEQESTEASSNADIAGEVNQNNSGSKDVNYDPDYMDEQEWNTCQDAYSMIECVSNDQYYAYGDGRDELLSADDPGGDAMDTYDRAQQGWENDTGNYEQAYEAGKAVIKDFYADRGEINEVSFEAFETLQVEEIMRDEDGNIIINSAVGLQAGLDEEIEYVPYRVEMTEDLEYHYLYMPDDHYYEELSGSY